jgi:hypothetical protein
MSDMLAEFDKSLGAEASFWHDHNLEVASELLDQFSSDDWDALQRGLLARPPYWQERCAEAIGYEENEDGIDALIALLGSPHLSAAAIAASELDNMAVRLPAAHQPKLLAIQAYLQQQQSSRCDDVQNLLDRLA